MTYEQFKQKFNVFPQDDSNFIHWNNTTLKKWEYDFLVSVGAINEESIIQEYPMMSISDGRGSDKLYDMDGDLSAIMFKVAEIKSQKPSASPSMRYVPRNYTFWTRLRKERDAAYVKENTAKKISEELLRVREEIGK